MIGSFKKKRIYLNEYNLLMGNVTYLPLVSGLLQAYAEEDPVICKHYEFMPFLFHIDQPESILRQYENPTIAAFSVMMWNEQLSLKVAQEVKRRYPQCKIIFGGAQSPHFCTEYFDEHPFIDITVRGQGEEVFRLLLKNLADGKTDLGDIPGISWRDPVSGEIRVNEKDLEFNNDMDRFPSPYLKGLYNSLLETRKDLKFQAILETNRGCPFECTFCYWGMGGLSRKFSFHSIDRVASELKWCAENKIIYVFNADSNFGQHNRDMDIVKILVETKKRYGYPEKFRTCYGKNTDEKIYEIAKVMFENGLEKGITLSRQSNDEGVQRNIKRGNIRMSTYVNLQKKFNHSNIPVYSELILGLPGESYESWKMGIEDLLQAGLKNQLFVYLCQVLPNTELADKDYREKFGIKTQRIVLNETHGSIRKPGWLTEYEDVIIGTDSMPLSDWKRMVTLSIVTMMFHSLKLGFFLLIYLANRFNIKYTDFLTFIGENPVARELSPIIGQELRHIEAYIQLILKGKGRGVELPDYAEIYWDIEEACFLRISENLDSFYSELFEVIIAFLKESDITYDEEEILEAIHYQNCRIPRRTATMEKEVTFRFNFPSYFDTQHTDAPDPLQAIPQTILVSQKDFQGDKQAYSRDIILWGRKSGTNLTQMHEAHEIPVKF